jgi:hypothetical protein
MQRLSRNASPTHGNGQIHGSPRRISVSESQLRRPVEQIGTLHARSIRKVPISDATVIG